MSKTLQVILAFLIVFACASLPGGSFTTVVAAQDSSGIDPLPGGVPPEATPITPPSTTETTTTRSQMINDLRTKQQADFQTAKDRYIATLTTQGTGTAISNSSNYKLSAILVSARYHKTIDVYLGYLLKIDTSISANSTGFEIPGSDDALNQMLSDITITTNSLTEFDNFVNGFTGVTDENLMAFSPELQDKSSNLKIQMDDLQSGLLNLVAMVE